MRDTLEVDMLRLLWLASCLWTLSAAWTFVLDWALLSVDVDGGAASVTGGAKEDSGRMNEGRRDCPCEPEE